MQKILVPTDFSPIAENALNYAIEIAAKFKSELILFHFYSFNRRTHYDWAFPDDEQPYVENLKQKMKATEAKFIEKITQKGLSLQTKVEEDHVFSFFENTVRDLNVNLIVMGSKGASGWKKVIFGSVAAHALDLAKVPLLVVPSEHSFHPLERIVLATDLNKISANLLLPLEKLAVKFDAKVTILNVQKNSNEGLNDELDIDLGDVEMIPHHVQMTSSINKSINEFISGDNYELLCLIRKEKGFFEGLFQKSVTKAQVYKSNIPLFILPEN